MQIAAAIVSLAVENDDSRGYTSFVLLIIELNLVVWVGYLSDRNAGNAIKEIQVCGSLLTLQGNVTAPVEPIYRLA